MNIKEDYFKHDDIDIITSLYEESIFIKIINNSTNKCYENNINITEFKSPFDTIITYELVCKCLNKIRNYDIFIYFKDNNVIIIFDIVFNNKYNIKFNININENIL
jgi:hypothetical protein